MINSISPININNQNKSRTSIFYVNDVHGKMTNMERIYTASKDFDTFTPSEKTDKLKLASGDIILGEDFKSNCVADKFLNWSGFIANALGNHELDEIPSNLAKFLGNSKYKLLAANIQVAQNSPLKDKIQKSIVYEENGNKYGILGIAPSDMKERVKENESMKEISVDDINTTIKDIQAEVDKFKSQGINKIILLSHSGYPNDIRIAKETTGVDIILGGHSHDLLENVTTGKNLFISKSGEPVVITQAGKDGENVGKLNVEWNNNLGIITKVQNNIIPTRGTYNRTLPMKYSVETILGKPEIVATVSKVDAAPKNRLIEPNANANFITDSMKSELNTDIALLNAANIRGNFSQGSVDTRLMADITPFKNRMVIANVTEPQLVEALKHGANSMKTDSYKPGLMIVSGLKYTVTKSGEIKDLKYIDKSGKESSIDINNPNPNKIYKTAMDDFCAKGGDNYFDKNKTLPVILQQFDYDKDKLACDYIKKLKQPVEIVDDKRITIEN